MPCLSRARLLAMPIAPRLRLSIAACLLAVLALPGCGGGEKRAAQYQTAAVDRGSIVARVSATGTLSALVTVQVGSQVSGSIKVLKVDFNSVVKKGQLLAQIDPALFKAAYENAKANRIAAEANLVSAQVNADNNKLHYERYAELLALDSIARQDFDTAKATYDASVAAVDAAKAALLQAQAQESQAELNLSYTQIVSPINGIVISRNVDLGQTVAASFAAPVLFLIAEDLRKMQVDTSVAESDVGRLRDGMTATFTVDAFPFEQFKGRIRQIRNNSTTVQNVVTYDAVIDVDNPDMRLRPGMTATMTVVVAERRDALRVSNAALRFRPPPGLAGAAGRQGGGAPPTGAGPAPGRGSPAGGAAGRAPGGLGQPSDQRVVWRLSGETMQPVRIRIGITDGTLTEVVSGELNPGDLIVTDVIGGEAPRGGFRLF